MLRLRCGFVDYIWQSKFPHDIAHLDLHFFQFIEGFSLFSLNEPPHDKTKKWHVRPAKTQISPGIRPGWSESSLYTHRVAKDRSFFSFGERRLWPDWTDAQADLSLRWAHMLFCLFCHEVAQICWTKIWYSPPCNPNANHWVRSLIRFGLRCMGSCCIRNSKNLTGFCSWAGL